MTTSRDILIKNFCARHASADAVQVMALRGDLLLDVAKFQADWGPERADGVAVWIATAPGDRIALHALSRTGETVGPDERWETVASVFDPPVVA